MVNYFGTTLVAQGPFSVSPSSNSTVWPSFRVLKPGGIVLAYTPSIIQVSKFHQGLAENGFGLVETTEVIHRNWHVEGDAIRPNHRMVAHTGFLTYAHLLVS